MALVNEFEFITSRQIYQILVHKGEDIKSQDKLNNKLEQLIKSKILTRYYFMGEEGKCIYRIYCLEKMGKYLLNSRGVECKWQPTDNTKPVAMIKKRLAGNQIIIAYLRKVSAFDKYTVKPAITAKKLGKVFKAHAGIKLTKNGKSIDFIFEAVRREEDWEKKLVDRLQLYKDFYESFVQFDSGFETKPQLVFVCEDEKVVISDQQQQEIDEKSGACSVVYLAQGDSLIGALCISDPPRAEAKEAIEQLQACGIQNVIMLTGDSERAAKIIAAQLGITTVYAQVLPEDKHRYIEMRKNNGERVIMVGDGINDAPALAAANVSVAMSDASDIAKETADITLRETSLKELVTVRQLSTKLMERINRNYRFIVGFNSALLLGGVFGVLSPAASALLHNASTMAICMKSMTPLDQNTRRTTTK